MSAGKALYWGTSRMGGDEIRAAWEIAERHHLHRARVVEQPQYNIFGASRVENEYARLYEDLGLGLTTWSPAGSGLLTGKYLDGVPDGSRASLPGYEWLRAMLTDPKSNEKVPGPEGRLRRARVQPGADVARLVRQEPPRLHGDHRRQPARAGAGEHEGDRSRRPAGRPLMQQIDEISRAEPLDAAKDERRKITEREQARALLTSWLHSRPRGA